MEIVIIPKLHFRLETGIYMNVILELGGKISELYCKPSLVKAGIIQFIVTCFLASVNIFAISQSGNVPFF